MSKKIELQLIRSSIGAPKWMKVIVRTLGLKKLGQKKIVMDTGSIRGMVKRVPHLVVVKEI